MKRKTLLKHNNAGISLVEVLAAMAIGAIVLTALIMLVSGGVQSYRKQTVMARLQNDANIALNQMSDKIMEANMVTMSNRSDGVTEYIKLQEDIYYIYDAGDSKFYQAKSLTESEDRSLLCENVTDFKISLERSSLIIDENTGAIEVKGKGIQIRIFIKLENMNQARETYRTVKVRNTIDDVFIDFRGTYKSIKEYLIKDLGNYIAEGY